MSPLYSEILTHFWLNEIRDTIYWKGQISILGILGYAI